MFFVFFMWIEEDIIAAHFQSPTVPFDKNGARRETKGRQHLYYRVPSLAMIDCCDLVSVIKAECGSAGLQRGIHLSKTRWQDLHTDREHPCLLRV